MVRGQMINAFCYYFGSDGMAHHAAGFLPALNKYEDVALVSWDHPPDSFPLPPVTSRMLGNACRLDEANISMGIGPIERMRRVRGSKRIAFIVWETTRLPARKRSVLDAMDEIWVPSSWGRAILIDNGIGESRIRVVPEGVDTDVFTPPPQHGAERVRAWFRFLCVGKWEERKGIADLVVAFCEEFRPQEPVELLLHCYNYCVPVDPAVELSRLAGHRHPRITMSRPRSLQSLVQLYQSSDAFVMPTRAEGWGLPILEAMACGLPVIVTDYSAPTDFLDASVAYLIPVEKMVSVHDPWFYPGGEDHGQWAQPDLKALKFLMRYVYENRSEAKKKGELARRHVCRHWTWDHAAHVAYRHLRK